jgi:hypothetical protein
MAATESRAFDENGDGEADFYGASRSPHAGVPRFVRPADDAEDNFYFAKGGPVNRAAAAS